MIKFPNCKINIGLNIINKRDDGFHNLQTLFYPIALHDAVEIIQDHQKDVPVNYSSTGLPIPNKPNDNICIRAYDLLKKDFPLLAPIKLHLHKAIPIGAGLGGGSSDGAFMLKLLNEKFELNLTQGQLIDYASQLGSDCPFFMINQPCFATGRGEILEPVSLDLSDFKLLIINPGIHVDTSQAFNKIQPGKNKTDLKALIDAPVEHWKNTIINDFEETVFEVYPEIGNIKEDLYKKGALYASMSGSGSTVYGIFKKGDKPVFNYPPHYFLRWI